MSLPDAKHEDLVKSIQAQERAVLERPNIREKLKFLDFLELTYHKHPIPAIHHALFSLARDISPAVRLRSLQILANVAIVPPELIDSTLSKGDENDDTSRADRPHIGTFGMCLEDAVPEVRAMAIRAIGASIRRSDDPCALEVMTAIAQMINDSSVSVRAASIEALVKVSRIINHLITIEDQQLRMVLPVLTASDSSARDRKQVISFLSQVETASHEQTARIFEELGTCVVRYPKDKEELMCAAYNLGYNNSHFMRFVAADFLATLSSIKKLRPVVANDCVFIKLISLLSACRRTPFMLTDELVKVGHLMQPLFESLEKKRRGLCEKKTTFVRLADLEAEIRRSPAALNRVIEEDSSLKDACDYILGNEPPGMFKVVESLEDPELVSVTKYVGVITDPQPNNQFSPYAYNAAHNFFLNIHGRVTPKPPQGTTAVVCIEAPLLGLTQPTAPSYKFDVSLDDDGNFSINPSMSLPPIYPHFPVKMAISLINDEIGQLYISEQIKIWFKDTSKTLSGDPT